MDEQSRKMATEHQSEIHRHERKHDLLVVHMHKAQEELERYYLKEKERKQLAEQKKKPLYNGAADRIKNQLSYRLGAIMVKRSKKIIGWLGMPVALAKEVRVYRKDQASRSGKKLPPIATYSDAQEAEKVKSHLSYRLGSIMVQYATSPAGWIKMPFLLHREVGMFKKEPNKEE
jgi:hypothetical protein